MPPTIERGQKVAFVGKMGKGNLPLVKAIMGRLILKESLQLGHNCLIGYFAQDQASRLDEDLTVFQTIDNIAVGDIH